MHLLLGTLNFLSCLSAQGKLKTFPVIYCLQHNQIHGVLKSERMWYNIMSPPRTCGWTKFPSGPCKASDSCCSPSVVLQWGRQLSCVLHHLQQRTHEKWHESRRFKKKKKKTLTQNSGVHQPEWRDLARQHPTHSFCSNRCQDEAWLPGG